jgi:hypothetical protein
MSDMKTHKSRAQQLLSGAHRSVELRVDQRGALNLLVIPLIMLFLFFIGAIGFGFWAYSGKQDYKNNVDQKVAAAAVVVQKNTQDVDAKQYAEEAKKPFDTYIGPAAFGNVTLKYPKTWSAYIIENPTGGTPVDGYLHPGFVPSISSNTNAFALRVQVTQQSYDSVLSQYSSLVDAKKLTVAPYSLPKVPSIVGSRVEGQLTSSKQGTMIILPLRNMTLKIWTESNAFKADLDNNILPNFTFQP